MTAITIKGIKEGVLVTVGDGEWSEALPALLAKMRENAEFFRGALLFLQFGGRGVNASELGKLRGELSDLQINLWMVLSESTVTINAAKSFGLETEFPKKETLPVDLPPIPLHEDGTQAILIDRTLRSGKSVNFDGHVVVIGDVNAGAEIIATGNVVVWGRVRGTVQAGVKGDTAAVVCALDLAPTQLRIADAIATSPKRRGKPEPEIALVRDGKIVAERWKA